MTYLIGNRSISFSNDTLSEEDQKVIRAHPKLFKICLNSTAHRFLLSLKRIIHLYTDIITIYSTLLFKIPNYDDITSMTNKTKLQITRLEEDLNGLLGREPLSESEGWENKNYEAAVKRIALIVLGDCSNTFELVSKNLNCIDIFFGTFDNLRKLLIPGLLSYTKIIQKVISDATSLFGLTTILSEISKIGSLSPVITKQLAKIDILTSGIERETKLLNLSFSTIDPSLQQYTNLLLGKAVLKRDISNADCQLLKRRAICFQAAEHVVSIPLSGMQNTGLSMQHITKQVFYIVSAILLVFVAVIYRLYNVVFG